MTANNDIPQKKLLTIINYADKPVYSTAIEIPDKTLYPALGLITGTPLEAVTASGEALPLFHASLNGAGAVRAYISLKPGERMDLKLRPAKEWAKAEQFANAVYDPATGKARLSNGLLCFDYLNGKWNMAFAGPRADRIAGAADRSVFTDCRFEGWLDSERRGRLMGMSPEKVAELGLLSLGRAKIIKGEATVNPDGSATLRMTKGFDGFAKDVVWDEIYTLLAGVPVLTYSTRFSTAGGAKRQLAYVEHGAGMKGSCGRLIRGKLAYKCDNPKEPARILISGSENSFTRLNWRGERCWVGIGLDETGCGAAITTLQNVTRPLTGSSVWQIGGDFYTRLIDAQQENFPYEFSQGKPLETGLAFAAFSGGVDVWNQSRSVWQALTANSPPRIESPVAAYLGETPIKPAEVSAFRLPSASNFLVGQQAALEMPLRRNFRISAKADGAAADRKVEIRVRELVRADFAKPGSAIPLLTLAGPEEKTVDFTAVTGWKNVRKTFLLEIIQPQGARLARLAIEPASHPAPELECPADNMQMTDFATYFRWLQVKGAIDYEIQMSRDAAFTGSAVIPVRSEADMPYYMPADKDLPAPGKWYWRVRAVEEGRPGEWSAVRSFTVNSEIGKKPLLATITPEQPLFTIEGHRIPDWSKFKNTIPEDIKPFVAVNSYTRTDFISHYKPLQEAGLKFFIRTQGPGPQSHWTPLAHVEHLFQTYPNAIGIMGGETLTASYAGGPTTDFTNRLLKLCGKYGRIFYEADGTYPGENKWQELYTKKGRLMLDYGDHIVFAQKNNILHRQFVSQSSVLGLYLAGNIAAQGAWEDGGWYWEQVGFRGLGEILGQRGGSTDMPANFWNLNFLMGVARGCTVFSFEGQCGTMHVRDGWTIAKDGLPKNALKSQYWTRNGELTPNFNRYCLPFMRAVIRHKLVPSRAQVVEQVRLAVYNDGVPKKDDGDQYYYEWEALYRATYGFRDIGVIPGTLMEFFPNKGRYYYIPVFPQGKVELKGVEIVPLSQLMDTAAVKARFDKAYPEWYSGNALVTIVGDTLAVLNSNENTDVTENYSVPLKDRGAFANIAGKIATHSYLMGKFEDGNRSLWLQANAEYPERDTELTLTCKGQPKVKITPAAAAKTNQWDAASGKLTLRLSHTEGAVEVEIKF